jgi:hypothetical protein
MGSKFLDLLPATILVACGFFGEAISSLYHCCGSRGRHAARSYIALSGFRR